MLLLQHVHSVLHNLITKAILVIVMAPAALLTHPPARHLLARNHLLALLPLALLANQARQLVVQNAP